MPQEVDVQDNTDSKPTRRERERERHRMEIPEAAEDVFSQKGIAGATVEDVAARAEFAVGTLYNFFPSKDELIRQVFIRLIKQQVAQIEEDVMPHLDAPLVALKRLVETWMTQNDRHARLIRAGIALRISLGKNPGNPPDDAEIAELLKRRDRLLVSIFEAGAKAGVFLPMNPRHLAIVFDGTCKSFCIYWQQICDDRPLEVRSAECFEVVQTAITGRVPGKGRK